MVAYSRLLTTVKNISYSNSMHRNKKYLISQDNTYNAYNLVARASLFLLLHRESFLIHGKQT